MSASNSPVWQASAIDATAITPPAFPITPFDRLRRSGGFMLGLCLLLIIAADVLFYRQYLGWSGAIFAVLLLAAVMLRSVRFLATLQGRIIAAGFLVICLLLIEQPSPLRITMAILGIITLAMINSRGWTCSVPAWLGRWSEFAARCVFQLPLDFGLASRWNQKHGGRGSRSQRLIINWIVPILLSLVFIGLFALANPIISKWLERAGTSVGNFFRDFSEYLSFGRAFLWLSVGFIAWTLLRGRSRSRIGSDDLDSRIFTPSMPQTMWPRPESIVRCLVLFNLVFAVQMGLDLMTILSNGLMLPDGIDFKVYARRGAYPLVATALLAAAFVLIMFPTRQSDGVTLSRPMRTARLLVFLWIGQNILLTTSAIWRLAAYVETYGLTHLRVAAGVWMLLVAMGLMWIIWRILRHRSNAWLTRVNFVTLFVTLFACCFPNWDHLIACYDVEKCMEVGGPGPRIDLEYLHGLGPEAIPTLDWLANRLPNDQVGAQAAKLAADLRDELHAQLQTWQGWTLRRARLVEQSGI